MDAVVDAGARGEALRVDRVWFLNNGWMHTRKGHGRWAADAANGGRIKVKVCGRDVDEAVGGRRAGSWRRTMRRRAASPVCWRQTRRRSRRDRPVSGGGGNGAEGLERIVGSGPYRGRAIRRGLLPARGRAAGAGRSVQQVYLVARDGRDACGGRRPRRRRGGGDSLVVPFSDHFVIRMPKRACQRGDGRRSGDGELPLYGDGVETASAEGFGRRPRSAPTCARGRCGGRRRRTRRPLLARAVEGCCGSWAGRRPEVSGGQSLPPWAAVWGAPPEAQGAGTAGAARRVWGASTC